jgi:hypothetical protein
VVLSSSVALLSAAAVLVAGAAYFVTVPDRPAATAELIAAPAAQRVAPRQVIEPAHRPVVRRDAYVDVYNNSSVKGLAGRTAATIADAGWKVVGSDNWYGTIPASTVYYPTRLRRQAELLAHDLGIERVRPSIDPMQMDRLTVILTAGFG